MIAKTQHKPINSLKLIQQDIFRRIQQPVKPGKLIWDPKVNESFVFLQYKEMSIRLYDRFATVKKQDIKHIMQFKRIEFGRFMACINPSKQPMSDFFAKKA